MRERREGRKEGGMEGEGKKEGREWYGRNEIPTMMITELLCDCK